MPILFLNYFLCAKTILTSNKIAQVRADDSRYFIQNIQLLLGFEIHQGICETKQYPVAFCIFNDINK